MNHTLTDHVSEEALSVCRVMEQNLTLYSRGFCKVMALASPGGDVGPTWRYFEVTQILASGSWSFGLYENGFLMATYLTCKDGFIYIQGNRVFIPCVFSQPLVFRPPLIFSGLGLTYLPQQGKSFGQVLVSFIFHVHSAKSLFLSPWGSIWSLLIPRWIKQVMAIFTGGASGRH